MGTAVGDGASTHVEIRVRSARGTSAEVGSNSTFDLQVGSKTNTGWLHHAPEAASAHKPPPEQEADPSAAVVKPAGHDAQPGAGVVALPAGDVLPMGHGPQLELRPEPAGQMGTTGEMVGGQSEKLSGTKNACAHDAARFVVATSR